MYFEPPLKGFPLEIGTGARGQTKLPGRERTLTMFLAVWIQYMNATDGRIDRQTDGRTDPGRQQRPRLRIVWRGNKCRQQTLFPISFP